MKTVLISCALIAPLIPALVRPQATADQAAASPCLNVIAHEPTVLYEFAGSTLAAQFDRTLTVYADGSMLYADALAQGGGQAIRAMVTPETARAFKSALIAAGAKTLCDQQYDVTDVPLHTLTILGGTQDTRAHTFSYWVADSDYAAVDDVVEAFIAEHFE